MKARILWEGFERVSEAKRCLKEVLKKVPQHETLHVWASSYYDRLVEHEKETVLQRPKKNLGAKDPDP